MNMPIPRHKSKQKGFGILNDFKKPLLVLLQICLASCSHVPTEVSVKPVEETDRNKITLSPQALESANLEILSVENRPNEAKIITTGEIKADDNRVFHINSIVSGRVIEDDVTLGKTIQKSDKLAVIQNLEVARTFGDYIHQEHQNEVDLAQVLARLDLAKKNVQRLRHLNQEGIVAEKDLLAAENQQRILEIDLKGLKEHQLHIRAEAKELLATYGVSLDEEEKKGIDRINSSSPVIAPRGGVVIKKNVTVGDVVSPSEVLYIVADLSQVWLDIAVYDKDLQRVKEGQLVSFRSDSLRGTKFTGTITYIQPIAGETKTFLARVILPNGSLSLKPGMFGQAEITAHSDKLLPYVYDRSLQKYGNETFVFIKNSDGSFEKHNVVLGDRIGDGYLIKEGISAGQNIVGSGSFKLKSELFKSTIGED